MAQNITLMGASYSAVPAVTLPKTGGGTASFTDVSDTTATAADVASGTYFYTAAGEYTEGTASGGGGGSTLTVVIADMGEIYYVDASGTYQHISSPSSATFPAPEHSLIAFLTDAAVISPGCENITTRASVALGSRANYRYAIMFQVESD